MPNIPEDIYPEILVRLPVKSLLRCKCVCKSWFGIIDDPSFIKSHLNLTVQKNNPNLMLRGFNNNSSIGNSTVIHSIKHNSLYSDISESDDDVNAVEMDYPFKSNTDTVELVGSCNGLVCMKIGYKGSSFCIWNPATNEYKKLPESLNKKKNIGGYDAFGYDYKTDDYKLVCVVDSYDYSSLVEVYTLGADSWRSIQRIPYWFVGWKGVFINGALHWVGTKRGNTLASFEINGETFNDLLLPKELLENNPWNLYVGVLEACLCVLVKVTSSIFSEVWVMQDYGVYDSWTKIAIHLILSNDRHLLRLMGFLLNGKIIFSDGGNLVIYDQEHKSVREQNVCDSAITFTSGVNYFETLVALNSGTYSGIEAHTEESTESRKRKRLLR